MAASSETHQVVRLWPGGAPGSEGWTQKEIEFGGRGVRNVVDPTIMVYLLFDNRTVVIFSQGASGDQNPRDFRSATTFMGQRAALTQGRGPFGQTLGAPTVAPNSSTQGFNAQQASSERRAIPLESVEAYKKTIARTGAYAHMLGSMLASSAVRVMRESIQPVDTARIWVGPQTFACPGRIRNDADHPARENVFPGHNDGPDVNRRWGMLRIGDVHLGSVNGEIYSQIGMRIKAEAPASGDHCGHAGERIRQFRVRLFGRGVQPPHVSGDGSRLKPGCAERKIVSTAVGLIHRAEGAVR